MSASEIEQAAVEGGLSAEFVREAIHRISTTPTVVDEETSTKSTPEEWMVAASVTLIMAGVVLYKAASTGRHPTAYLVLCLLAAVTAAGVLYLAGVGAKSLLSPKQTTSGLTGPQTEPKVEKTPVNIGNLVVHGLLVATLATIPFNYTGGENDGVIFLAVLLPLMGGFTNSARLSFWKGAGAGAIVATFLGIASFYRTGIAAPTEWPMAVGLAGAVCGLFSLGGFGLKKLFTRSKHVRPSSNRTEMLAQLFELQAALDRHQATRTFLSVDVVGSSAMKATANELEAEFSFRQYQTWVAEVTRAFGGEVQLAAGDGAMAMFRDTESAVKAAKFLQLGIHDFNANKSRLSTPFEIRCGLSEGKIGIDSKTSLGQIQSPVLDRAAFLQKYAEPGSVVVDQALIGSAMPVLGTLHQRQLIDGKPVYCWP
jgi:class 3 adenylate cyclase